jgi:RNA polymerase sigma-70 factor (ECF subfamily)
VTDQRSYALCATGGAGDAYTYPTSALTGGPRPTAPSANGSYQGERHRSGPPRRNGENASVGLDQAGSGGVSPIPSSYPLSRAMFGELYEQQVDRIYAYLYYRTGSHQDAEDLTARVFFQALSRIDSFNPVGGSVAAWLFTIAHNLLANYHRTRARRPSARLEAAATAEDPADAPAALLEAADDARRVREAMGRLSQERQHLLLLKYVQNMSNADIGRTIGRNEGAVKSQLRRTLAALRRELEKDARVHA